MSKAKEILLGVEAYLLADQTTFKNYKTYIRSSGEVPPETALPCLVLSDGVEEVIQRSSGEGKKISFNFGIFIALRMADNKAEIVSSASKDGVLSISAKLMTLLDNDTDAGILDATVSGLRINCIGSDPSISGEISDNNPATGKLVNFVAEYFE